jgi:hypothetical protein
MSVEQSEKVTELFSALVAFSAEVEQPVKNARNDHFGNTFADLRQVLAAVRPVLIKHGLTVVQLPAASERGIGLCTQICHAPSGQWIRATVGFPVEKTTPQAAASAITYARRYGLMAALGLAAEDDDGEAAMGRDTRIQRRDTRDGPPIVAMNPHPADREQPRADNEQRETRSAARAAVRRANAAAGGSVRTMDDIANMGRPEAAPPAPPAPPAPAPSAVKPPQHRGATISQLRSARPSRPVAVPNAPRPVPNPRAVTGYNEMANTIHAMTPVKLTGELDEYNLLIPPGRPPKFTSGENQGRAYSEVTIDTLRAMAESRGFLASAPPLNKLWVAYLIARIDANTRAANTP